MIDEATEDLAMTFLLEESLDADVEVTGDVLAELLEQLDSPALEDRLSMIRARVGGSRHTALRMLVLELLESGGEASAGAAGRHLARAIEEEAAPWISS